MYASITHILKNGYALRCWTVESLNGKLKGDKERIWMKEVIKGRLRRKRKMGDYRNMDGSEEKGDEG